MYKGHYDNSIIYGFLNNVRKTKIIKHDFTFPALKMPKSPARFLSFKADMVPLLVSDFNPLLDERLTVEWILLPKPLPFPLLDESEPTLPLLIVLRSSKGKSSGGRNPDLYRSTTNRESFIYGLLKFIEERKNEKTWINKSNYLFGVDAISYSNYSV